nr:PAS domain S-box protein [Methanohalobium evestigatum]
MLYSIYESMSEGVCIFEIIYDSNGYPTDYMIIDSNSAYESIIGYRKEDLAGSKASDIFGTEYIPHLYTYAKIAETGKQTNFETYCPYIGKHYRVSIISPEKGKFITILTDITGQNEIDDELKAVYENVPVVIMLVDSDRRILKLNKNAELFAGSSAKNLKGLRGGDALGCLHSLDDPEGCGFGPHCKNCKVRNTVLDTFNTGTNYNNVEVNLPFIVNGYEKHLTLLLSTSFINTDNQPKVLVSIQDITDKKTLEKNICEKDSLLKDITENIWDMVCLADKNCNFVYVSPSHEHHLGYHFEDLVDKNIFEFIHPDDLKHIEKLYFEFLQTLNPIRSECRFRHSKGHYVWLETSVNVVYDDYGDIKYFVFNSRDITERKETEEKLKYKEEILELALNSTSLAVWDCDIKKGELYFSEQFSKLLDCGNKELVLDTQTWWNLIHPDDVNRVSKALNDYYAGRTTVFESEYRIKDNSGKWLWLLDKGKITKRDNSGNSERLTGVILDITDKVEREEKIREYANKIKESKITREKELHHRIKNNLQVISSLLNLQSEKFEDEDVVEAFKDTQNRVISMSFVHQKLYQTNNLDNLNSKDYIKELVSYLTNLYNKNNIDLNIDVQNCYFGIDIIIPLGMLINELVSNSLKYAFPEGESGKVDIQLYKNYKECYTLIIADNGRGIPENIDIRDAETLGFQLVSSLVNQVNGDFEIYSGNGTMFIIEFSG